MFCVHLKIISICCWIECFINVKLFDGTVHIFYIFTDFLSIWSINNSKRHTEIAHNNSGFVDLSVQFCQVLLHIIKVVLVYTKAVGIAM